MSSDRGFTLLELLIAISIAGILTGVAIYNLKGLENSGTSGALQLLAYIKKARGKALASTEAYTVQASSTTTATATYADSCSSNTQTTDPEMTFRLPEGVTMSTGWSLCYNSRGTSNSTASITVTDGTTSKVVQVVLGGGAQIQ